MSGRSQTHSICHEQRCKLRFFGFDFAEISIFAIEIFENRNLFGKLKNKITLKTRYSQRRYSQISDIANILVGTK